MGQRMFDPATQQQNPVEGTILGSMQTPFVEGQTSREVTPEMIERTRRELRTMEDTLRLQQAAQTTVPSTGKNSEADEAVPATREPSGLPPDVLREMGVLLYPRWQDWMKVFDEDDIRWKRVWNSELANSELIRTVMKRVEETRNMTQVGLRHHEKEKSNLKNGIKEITRLIGQMREQNSGYNQNGWPQSEAPRAQSNPYNTGGGVQDFGQLDPL